MKIEKRSKKQINIKNLKNKIIYKKIKLKKIKNWELWELAFQNSVNNLLNPNCKLKNQIKIRRKKRKQGADRERKTPSKKLHCKWTMMSKKPKAKENNLLFWEDLNIMVIKISNHRNNNRSNNRTKNLPWVKWINNKTKIYSHN